MRALSAAVHNDAAIDSSGSPSGDLAVMSLTVTQEAVADGFVARFPVQCV